LFVIVCPNAECESNFSLQDNFIEGKATILTLKDQDVLAEDGDVLINVNLVDDERYKKVSQK